MDELAEGLKLRNLDMTLFQNTMTPKLKLAHIFTQLRQSEDLVEYKEQHAALDLPLGRRARYVSRTRLFSGSKEQSYQ